MAGLTGHCPVAAGKKPITDDRRYKKQPSFELSCGDRIEKSKKTKRAGALSVPFIS